MAYKKRICLLLCVFFQAHSMQMISELPAKKLVNTGYEITSIENYNYNKAFFHYKMHADIEPIIISHLDHRSNIRFIMTTNYLYSKYVKQPYPGIHIYNNCLFTPHSFVSIYSHFDFDFNAYNRALFHYAGTDRQRMESLLQIKDHKIQDSLKHMLQSFSVDRADRNAVAAFYQQSFSYGQIVKLGDDFQVLTTMLKRGVSPHAKCLGNSLIKWCLANKKTKSVEVILHDDRFDPNTSGNDRWPLLCNAVWHDNMRIVQTLLDHPRMDVDKYAQDSVEDAIYKKNIKALKLLLPKVDLKKYGSCFLHYALYNDIRAVKILLSYSEIDPNEKNAFGFTPLHQAARYNDIDLVRLLLSDKRVDPNITTYGFLTAYWYTKDPKIIRLLAKRTSFYKKYPLVNFMASAVATSLLTGVVYNLL